MGSLLAQMPVLLLEGGLKGRARGSFVSFERQLVTQAPAACAREGTPGLRS